MFGTDTFLNGYARTAKDSDFASLRLVVAGAEAVKPETRRIWRERFGAEIVEGFGLTEAVAGGRRQYRHAWPRRHGRPPAARHAHAARAGRGHCRGRPAVACRPQCHDGLHDRRPAGRTAAAARRLARHAATSSAIDREGFISIRGRAKRFAKIAGEMVSLGAVEMLVQALWPEEHHAVVSVPDKRRGERIVLVTTADEADPKALRQYRQESRRRRADGAGRHRQGRRRCRCSAPARPTTSRRAPHRRWRGSGFESRPALSASRSVEPRLLGF